MLRRFSLRQIILGAIAAYAAVTLVAVLALLMRTSATASRLEGRTQQMLADEEIAAGIVRHTDLQLLAAHEYGHARDPELAARFRREGMEVYDRLRLYLFRDLSAEERLLVERIRELHESIEVEAQRAFTLGSAAAHDLDVLPQVDSLRSALSRLVEMRRASIISLMEQHEQQWRWLYAAVAVLALLFLIGLFAAGALLRRRLIDPVEKLADAARRIGAGDFDARVEVRGRDELGVVAESFNAMAGRLEVARRETAQAERRFRDLLEGLSTVVWEADAESGQITYASPQAEEVFGYPQADWLERGFKYRLVHPDDRTAVQQQTAESVAAGLDHEVEYRAVCADGSILWVRDFVRVLPGEAGRATRLRGVITDITAARAAQAALRQSEERYHSLVDRVPVGLYRSTPDGRIVEANPALLHMLGYDTLDELIATHASAVYLDADDRHRWQRLLDNAAGVVEVDRQHRHRDGSILWLRDMARAIRAEDGRVLYYEGALQDVTERVRAEEAVRRSEARFRSLIENASDGVLILDRAARIVYQSPAVQRILGYTPDETLGRTAYNLVHPDDLPMVQQSLGELADRAGQARSVEFRCMHRDGSWRVLHATGTNLLDDPVVSGFVINMLDATAHRELEAQLQHSQKMEAVGRLAGGIAHDFNNLLTAITGYSDLLAARPELQGEGADEVAEIRRAVERAARLTRQLLAFSRRQVVRPRPTDFGTVVRELEAMLRRIMTEDVPLRITARRDCWVHADPGQLEQIVMNLVVNARDAEPRECIDVTVEHVTVEPESEHVHRLEPGEYVRLEVSDDGRGIDPDVLPHIFEPFFTTKEVGKGTGLGLATVYGIVGEYGGRTFVESVPGDGTRMSVYLPRIEAPARLPTMTSDSGADAREGSECVLLVEDEPAVRSLAERILRRHGYDVHTAGNGTEAVAWLDENEAPLDLLITDVVMPEMGGVQLAALLLERRPGLPVLFISGYAADALPSADDGGRPLHFLEKPFTPAALVQTVRAILDESRAAVG